MSFLCPRRWEPGQSIPRGNAKDRWVRSSVDRKLHVCSYCGSADPAEVLEGIEEHRFQVGTTTKNYKFYVLPVNLKCYFQHFTTSQRHVFLALHNERRNDDFFETVPDSRGVQHVVGFSEVPFFARLDTP